MILMFWATPLTPIPLFPAAPIVPAVSMPWPPLMRSSSVGSPSTAGRFSVGADEVGSVDVVDDPVVVVVNAVARYLAWVRPGDRRQVGVFESIAGIEVGNDHGGVAGRSQPGPRGIDVGAGDGRLRADLRHRVEQAPLHVEQRVIRNRRGFVDAVGFGQSHGGSRFQFARGLG